MQPARKIIDNLQEQLQARMKDKKITATELGRNAGLNESAVRNILNGKSSNPGIESLSAIAKSLGCSVNDLIEQEELRDLTSNRSEDPRTKEIITWDVDLYQDCTKAVENHLKDKSFKPSGEQILFFIKETYLYSQRGKGDKPDAKFIEWIIDNYS